MPRCASCDHWLEGSETVCPECGRVFGNSARANVKADPMHRCAACNAWLDGSERTCPKCGRLVYRSGRDDSPKASVRPEKKPPHSNQSRKAGAGRTHEEKQHPPRNQRRHGTPTPTGEPKRTYYIVTVVGLIGLALLAYFAYPYVRHYLSGGDDPKTSSNVSTASPSGTAQPTPVASPSNISQSEAARVLKELQEKLYTYGVPAVLRLKSGAALEITASRPYWSDEQWAVVPITVSNVGDLPLSGSLTSQMWMAVSPGTEDMVDKFEASLAALDGTPLSDLALEPGEWVSGRAVFGPEGDPDYVTNFMVFIAFESGGEKVLGIW